jgi:hypothetical protein
LTIIMCDSRLNQTHLKTFQKSIISYMIVSQDPLLFNHSPFKFVRLIITQSPFLFLKGLAAILFEIYLCAAIFLLPAIAT